MAQFISIVIKFVFCSVERCPLIDLLGPYSDSHLLDGYK